MTRLNPLLTILFALMISTLSAQSGSLDPTFGTNGLVKTSFIGILSSSALQADGKIVVAGRSEAKEFALLRFNPDGTLDNTFGSGGLVTTKVGPVHDMIHSIALQPDGKIVAAGYSQNQKFVKDFALARYDTAGALDTTFGKNGLVVNEFNMGFGDYVIRSVAIQPDGKIVAAGYVKYEINGQFILARYNEDGALDDRFGTEGILVTDFSPGKADFSPGGDMGRAVLLQPDDKIIVAGHSGYFSSNDNFALARYHSNGTLDNSFGIDGKVTTDFNGFHDRITSLALQPDGKIIAAGFSYAGSGADWDFALARYKPDGNLDTTFDMDGKLITVLGPSEDAASAVALQTDGQILTAGSMSMGLKRDFVTTSYNPDGFLDDNFGTNGLLTTDFGESDDILSSVILQADGKIVVVGYSSVARIVWGKDNSKSVFTLARYLSE